MNTTNNGDTVTFDGDTWIVTAVGATVEGRGTCLHLKHSSKGRQTRAGWYPAQVCVWSIEDNVMVAR